MRTDQVTQAMINRMSEADQQRYQSSVPKAPGRKRDYLAELEKAQHVILENWLNQHELFYDHQRMDKRATNKKGIPDFVIGIWGLLVCIEFKRQGRELTPEQEHWRERALTKSRCQYYVCATAREAIARLISLP